MGKEESEPGSVNLPGTVGLCNYFYTRHASEFMVFRYAVKKSLLRLIGKKVMPDFSVRVFKNKLLYRYSSNFENRFLAPSSKNKEYKNFLFSFLINRIKAVPLLKSHFKFFRGRDELERRAGGRARFRRRTLGRVSRSKAFFLKYKKDYFLFKRKRRL